MRQPLWIVNTLLLFFVIAAFGFIALYQPQLPPREDIEPVVRKIVKKDSAKINIKKIYEYDLFDTYKQEQESPNTSLDLITATPPPPQPISRPVPELPKPQFLDPLDISLKGIIVLSDDTKNVAIIADNKTNQETIYKVGGKIDDAQLIRILRNKIIFIRSNGQQEVLYLRESDAKIDQHTGTIEDWSDIIKLTDKDKYLVNIDGFIAIIKNLAQFIDMLDLTTAYSKGTSAGIRVGSAEEHSLGATLGLKNGDLIIKINNIPATDNTNRLAIYKNVVTLQPKESITIVLKRDGQEIKLQYELVKDPFEETPGTKKPRTPAANISKQKAEKIERMKEKYDFAPTLEDIKMKEKENMLKYGAPKSNKSTLNSTE